MADSPDKETAERTRTAESASAQAEGDGQSAPTLPAGSTVSDRIEQLRELKARATQGGGPQAIERSGTRGCLGGDLQVISQLGNNLGQVVNAASQLFANAICWLGEEEIDIGFNGPQAEPIKAAIDECGTEHESHAGDGEEGQDDPRAGRHGLIGGNRKCNRSPLLPETRLLRTAILC